MTRLITVCSGKGGTGKTSTVANTGAALVQFGKDALVVDANMTTPNLGLHLGMPITTVNLHDVLAGDAFITEAVTVHPSGLRVIPAGISLNDLKRSDPRDMSDIMLDLLGISELVLIDSPAGLEKGALAAMEAGDEVIIVTNPELPAITDALKSRKMADELGTHIHGVVLNKVTGDLTESSILEVEAMLDAPVIATIPYDPAVPRSVAGKNPIVITEPRNPASIAWRQLAASLASMEFKPPKPIDMTLRAKLGRMLNKLNIFKT